MNDLERERYALLENVDELDEKVRLLAEALEKIDALDRKGHDSEVAADMGVIARVALSMARNNKLLDKLSG